MSLFEKTFNNHCSALFMTRAMLLVELSVLSIDIYLCKFLFHLLMKKLGNLAVETCTFPHN